MTETINDRGKLKKYMSVCKKYGIDEIMVMAENMHGGSVYEYDDDIEGIQYVMGLCKTDSIDEKKNILSDIYNQYHLARGGGLGSIVSGLSKAQKLVSKANKASEKVNKHLNTHGKNLLKHADKQIKIHGKKIHAAIGNAAEQIVSNTVDDITGSLNNAVNRTVNKNNIQLTAEMLTQITLHVEAILMPKIKDLIRNSIQQTGGIGGIGGIEGNIEGNTVSNIEGSFSGGFGTMSFNTSEEESIDENQNANNKCKC